MTEIACLLAPSRANFETIMSRVLKSGIDIVQPWGCYSSEKFAT